MSGWAQAFTIVGVFASFAACSAIETSSRHQARDRMAVACVSSGGSWVSAGWNGPECTRPNTQTEQERP